MLKQLLVLTVVLTCAAAQPQALAQEKTAVKPAVKESHARAISAAQSDSDTPHWLWKTISRGLDGGQTHAYPIALDRGQCLKLVAEQRGIDMVLALLDVEGLALAKVDSPNGQQGEEPLWWMAREAGNYWVVVGALEKEICYETSINCLHFRVDLALCSHRAVDTNGQSGRRQQPGFGPVQSQRVAVCRSRGGRHLPFDRSGADVDGDQRRSGKLQQWDRGVDRGGPGFLCALSADGIYRSTDQGQSWTKVSDLRLDPFGFDKMEAAGSNLLAISNSRVYLSTDQGGNWTLLSDGVTQAPFSELAVIGNQIFTTSAGRTIYSGTGFLPSSLAVVSAASFSGSSVGPESIVAAFGTRLATGTQAATTLPLPTQLAGTQVIVRNSAGVERRAPLFFVSPGQVNYLVPEGAATGAATVTITSGDGSLAIGNVNLTASAPGLFTANADGQGVPAGLALRIRAVGLGSFESIAQLDGQNRFVPAPIDLGPQGEQVYLILFGTGLRRFSAPPGVIAKIGGMDAPVTYAGAQGDLAGLDQINILLPRNLAGRGEVEVALTADNNAANMLKINLK
jgi:uncharacterized protein (TIGR03437 family)